MFLPHDNFKVVATYTFDISLFSFFSSHPCHADVNKKASPAAEERG